MDYEHLLFVSSDEGDFENVKLSIEMGARTDIRNMKGGDSPLILASRNGYLDIVQFLISSGANTEIINFAEDTALTVACMNNHLDVAKFLISSGANVHASYDDDGETSLNIASSLGYLEIVKLLILSGAYIETENFYRNTPLINAARKGRLDIVDFLIGEGADISSNKFKKLINNDIQKIINKYYGGKATKSAK